jgi:hypothetical protein
MGGRGAANVHGGGGESRSRGLNVEFRGEVALDARSACDAASSLAENAVKDCSVDVPTGAACEVTARRNEDTRRRTAFASRRSGDIGGMGSVHAGNPPDSRAAVVSGQKKLEPFDLEPAL